MVVNSRSISLSVIVPHIVWMVVLVCRTIPSEISVAAPTSLSHLNAILNILKPAIFRIVVKRLTPSVTFAVLLRVSVLTLRWWLVPSMVVPVAHHPG